MAGLTKADFPNHEWGDFRPAVTLLRCPKCKSRDLEIVETTEGLLCFRVVNGLLNRGAGMVESGGIVGLNANCLKCRHHWKPRKAHQIDDVASEDAGRAALSPGAQGHE